MQFGRFWGKVPLNSSLPSLSSEQGHSGYQDLPGGWWFEAITTYQMVRLSPEEQRICPVSHSRVATELGPEHCSVISFPASFSRIPKQMAPQMKSPVVSGLQKDPSLRGLLREKGSGSANSLGFIMASILA